MTSRGDSRSAAAELPRRVYLDTQFVFAYLVDSDPDHADAVRTVKAFRVVHRAGILTGFISVIVLDEVAWRVAGALYDTEHGAGAWRQTDRDEAFVRVRKEVAQAIESLLREPWLRIATADEEVCSVYASFMRRFALRPADLAHLAIAHASGMDAILTHDSDFHSLANSPVQVISYRRGE
ncbi:MAG: type II toxin-antitoxin system VapC family toxin [Armatimonadota bacterium]|nr:type II toxin-antitoxin system VapC family toxin [Armatimonadota bacterium]